MGQRQQTLPGFLELHLPSRGSGWELPCRSFEGLDKACGKHEVAAARARWPQTECTRVRVDGLS